MRNIIEELYYGNITPCDRDIVKGGTYSHLLHLVTRNEDDLMQTLTQAQQETFEKFKDCASELNDANELTAFTIGFKLGMRSGAGGHDQHKRHHGSQNELIAKHHRSRNGCDGTF